MVYAIPSWQSLKIGSGNTGEEEPGGAEAGQLRKGAGPRAWPRFALCTLASLGPSSDRGQVFARVRVSVEVGSRARRAPPGHTRMIEKLLMSQ